MDSLKDIANLLKDPQKSVSVGVLEELDLSSDRSVLRALVSTWPDDQQIVARVTWDRIGPNSGIIQFPQVGDLVVVELPDDNEDSAILTRTLSSKQDTIPMTATDSSLVLRSLVGKKAWLTSDTKINLSRGDSEPTENLVIGQKFKATYLNHLAKLITLVEKMVIQRETDATHNHLGIFGVPTNAPIQAAAMAAEKAELETIKSEVETLRADDVESEDILSDVAFTEK